MCVCVCACVCVCVCYWHEFPLLLLLYLFPLCSSGSIHVLFGRVSSFVLVQYVTLSHFTPHTVSCLSILSLVLHLYVNLRIVYFFHITHVLSSPLSFSCVPRLSSLSSFLSSKSSSDLLFSFLLSFLFLPPHPCLILSPHRHSPSPRQGRSKSLTHIDTLEDSGMLLSGEEMEGREGATDKLGVPDPHSIRRRKLSLATKVSHPPPPFLEVFKKFFFLFFMYLLFSFLGIFVCSIFNSTHNLSFFYISTPVDVS